MFKSPKWENQKSKKNHKSFHKKLTFIQTPAKNKRTVNFSALCLLIDMITIYDIVAHKKFYHLRG